MSKHYREEPHGNDGRRGMPRRPDDDRLAERTRAERVDAGLEPYDPADVPPASDPRPRTRLTDSEPYREAKAELDEQVADGRLSADQLQARKDRAPYPPTRYDK